MAILPAFVTRQALYGLKTSTCVKQWEDNLPTVHSKKTQVWRVSLIHVCEIELIFLVLPYASTSVMPTSHQPS